MALICEIGTATFPAAGDSGTETINLTKFSASEPLKAVLFVATNNVMNLVSAANALMVIGMTDGTNNGAVYAISDDNEITSNENRRISNAHCIVLMSTAQAESGTAVVTDWTATSFELTYAGVTSNSFPVNFIAIGGSDIEHAKVVHWDEPETDETNPKDVSVGFQPDCIITISAASSSASTSTTDARQMFGVCVGPNVADQRSYIWECVDNRVTMETNSRLEDAGAVGRALNSAYSSVHLTPQPDGFEANVTDSAATSTAAVQYFSLCLAGGRYQLLKPESPTGTQTDVYETDITDISGAIIVSTGGNVGFSSSGGAVCIGFIAEHADDICNGKNTLDGVADADCFAWRYNDRVIQIHDTSAGNSVLTAGATHDGGNFSLAWSDVDSASRDNFVLVMGSIDNTALHMGAGF